MRFGGLIAIDDLSFCGGARRDHRHHRPQRRRQDHGLQLHHRLLQADQRAHAAEPRRCRRRRRRGCAHRLRPALAQDGGGPDLPPGAHARLRDRGAGPRRAHLPEHPPVPRHDRAREPDRGAAQPADGGVGLDGAGPLRRPPLRRGRGPRRRARQVLARQGRPHGARRRSRRRPALRRPAPARDRARHVHGAGAAVPRRAGGRPQPARDRPTSPPFSSPSRPSTAPRSC